MQMVSDLEDKVRLPLLTFSAMVVRIILSIGSSYNRSSFNILNSIFRLNVNNVAKM